MSWMAGDTGQVPRPRLPLFRAGLAAAAVLPSLVTAARGVRRSLGAGNRRFDYTDSPQFRDGLFHNRLPATEAPEGSTAGMAAEFATKGRKGKPRRPVHLETPDLPDAGSRAGRHLDGARDRAPRARGPLGAHRPGVERPRLAVAQGRPAPQPPGADAAVRPAAAGRRADLPRPLRPPRHRDHRHAGADPGSTVRGAARDRRAPEPLGRARRPHHRARLGRVTSGRGAHLHLHRGAPLLRTQPGQQHHPLGQLGDRGGAEAGLLRWRHRLHPRVRGDRRALRPVRADHAADRCVRRPLARRAPQPRRGHPGAPRGARTR